MHGQRRRRPTPRRRHSLGAGADLEDALSGSDDYALAFTTGKGALRRRGVVIGEIVAGKGLQLDGKPIDPEGFQHF